MAIDAGSVYSSLVLKAGQYFATLEKADKKMDTFKGNLEKKGKQIEKLGKGMTKKVTTPILGIGAAALKVSIDFEEGISKVSALSGATGNDLKELEAKAREMGAKTKYSATEAAEGLKYMALAGWDTEQMIAGLEPALLLAGATGMELGTATDIVTDTMSMFGMEAEEATKMTDMLAYAQANSNTDVEQLGEALKYTGASANAMGYDLADTAALLGIFGDQSLKGSAAGTTLNAMFRDMKDKSKDGAIAIGETNVAIVDSQGNYRDMAEILADTEQATKDMTQAEKDQALGSIFGTQAIKGVNMVLEAGTDKLKGFEEGIRDSDGASKDMYDTMQNNLKGAIDNIKSALSEAGISMSETLIPIIQDVTKWINKWVDRFNELDEGTQETIVKIGLLVAAIGPGIFIFGKLSGTISKTIEIGGKLIGNWDKIKCAGSLLTGGLTKTVGFLFSPAGAIAVGVAGVIAAGVLLWKNWDTIKEKAAELKEKVSKKWDEFKEDTKTKFEESKNNAIEKMEEWKSKATDKAGEIGDGIRDKFNETVKSAKEWGKNLVEGIKNGMQEKKEFVVNKTMEIGNAISNGFKNLMGIHSPSRIFESHGKYTIDGLEKGLQENKHKPVSTMENLAKTIDDSFKKVQESVNLTTSIIENKFELWKLKNNELKGSSQELEMQLEMQRQKQNQLTEKLEAAKETLQKVIDKYGEGSIETKKYTDIVLQLQIEHEKLANEIDKTTDSINSQTKSLRDQIEVIKKKNSLTIRSGDRYVTKSSSGSGSKSKDWYSWTGSDGKHKSGSKSDFDKDTGYDVDRKEAERLSDKHGVDMGVAKDMAAKNKKEGKNIYHDGGWVGRPLFNLEEMLSRTQKFLKIDERAAILQDGEFILSRDMLGMIQGAMTSIDMVTMPKEYTEPSKSTSKGKRSKSGDINQNIVINSPTPLSPSESARKYKQASRQLAMEWGL